MCKKHKKYKAIREPSGNCFGCWFDYLSKNKLHIGVIRLMEVAENKNEVVKNSLVSLLRELGLGK